MVDPSLHCDAERLWRLVAARTERGADTEAIDKRIWDLYGERWAVMFTDLAGFSRRVEQFGIIHFLQTIYEHQKLLFPVLEEHNGVLVKAEGDSLLLLFRGVRGAYDCALAMLASCERVNARRKPEEQILLCIGIGYGDVLRVGEADVWGEQVNAASKLGEDTAKAGEILLTGAARDELSDVRVEPLNVEVPASPQNFRVVTPTSEV
jgi:class 3 adenylate cyclase